MQAATAGKAWQRARRSATWAPAAWLGPPGLQRVRPAPRAQEYYLGTGSVFGLLSALVGEGLPGAGPCLAVGNALRQGPVVYEFPQPLVASIQQGARDGDPTLVQLQLDLFRCAATPPCAPGPLCMQVVSDPRPCTAWGQKARSEKRHSLLKQQQS